jgi:hypothetical protein
MGGADRITQTGDAVRRGWTTGTREASVAEVAEGRARPSGAPLGHGARVRAGSELAQRIKHSAPLRRPLPGLEGRLLDCTVAHTDPQLQSPAPVVLHPQDVRPQSRVERERLVLEAASLALGHTDSVRLQAGDCTGGRRSSLRSVSRNCWENTVSSPAAETRGPRYSGYRPPPLGTQGRPDACGPTPGLPGELRTPPLPSDAARLTACRDSQAQSQAGGVLTRRGPTHPT